MTTRDRPDHLRQNALENGIELVAQRVLRRRRRRLAELRGRPRSEDDNQDQDQQRRR
jgi:hypothetical protein